MSSMSYKKVLHPNSKSHYKTDDISNSKLDKPIDININNEVDKLIGLTLDDAKYIAIKNKNEWKQCIYCEKYHSNEYFLDSLSQSPTDNLSPTYCFHCWGWLNAQDINLEQGYYIGNFPYDDIKKLLKKAYPIHLESKCTNNDCTFTKMSRYSEAKILHKQFIDLLELNKPVKQQSVYINFKNRNLNINYKESYIVI
jgi:hypothetical protein